PADLRRLADRLGADPGVQSGGIAAATLSARPSQGMDLLRGPSPALWPRGAGRDAGGSRIGTGFLSGGAAGRCDLGGSGRLVAAASAWASPDGSPRLARPGTDPHRPVAGRWPPRS